MLVLEWSPGRQRHICVIQASARHRASFLLQLQAAHLHKYPLHTRAGNEPSRSFTIMEKAPTKNLNMKALVGAFNQEKAFSVIVKLQTSRMFVSSSTTHRLVSCIHQHYKLLKPLARRGLRGSCSLQHVCGVYVRCCCVARCDDTLR